MKKNHNTKLTATLSAVGTNSLAACRRIINPFSRIGLALLTLTLAAVGPAFAQTTNIFNITNTVAAAPATVSNVRLESYTGDKGRLTVAVNQTNSVATELTVFLAGATTTLVNSETNFVDPDYFITNSYDFAPRYATLATTGVPGTGGGADVVLGVTSVTNNTSGTFTNNVTVTLNYTNLTSGDYDMAVEVTGVGVWRYPIPVKAGFMWSAGGGVNTNFNNTANWVGGALPSSDGIVILGDAGTNTATNRFTIAVTADTTIGSVSDIHTGNYTHWRIEAGATLWITNTGGYRQLMDLIGGTALSKIRASGAGAMVVSNANADFTLFSYSSTTGAAGDNGDFSGLNTLKLDVRKIAINDIAAYPNYGTNGAGNLPGANIYDWDWALTNFLRATHTDANNWASNSRNYGLTVNRCRPQTGNDGGMHFGLWNELYADSILFGGNAQVQNPLIDFRAASNSYIRIRNTDGVSRVSNMTLADAMDFYGTLGSSGATRGEVSFTKGTNDCLVETLLMGRDPLTSANGPANAVLFLGAGTFDVNNAFLGYQTGSALGTEAGHGSGRIDVTLGGTLRVNNTMVLGYTVTNNVATSTGFGQLNVTGAGSTALINSITAGGPVGPASTHANNISITTGGHLVITNGIATSDARANILNMSGGTLSMNVAGGVTNVFVNTITTGGSSNVLKVLSVSGISFPSTNPVISYVNVPAPNFSADVSALGAGYYAFVLNNTAGQSIDLLITTNPPSTLLWSGGNGPNWDNSLLNWNTNTVAFVPGDHAIFDDSSTQTNVSVVGDQLLGQTPGQSGMLVTNNVNPYTFDTGSLTGTIRKEGASEMTMNATHAGAFTIAGGSVTGSGTLGATTVGAGATLSYSGTILGLTTAGTVVNAGTVNGNSSVTGGSLVNDGVMAGTLAITGGTLSNSPSGVIGRTSGSTTLSAGTHLINNGNITNVADRINVNTAGSMLSGDGTFRSGVTPFDTGGVGRILVGAGGYLSPGNGSSNIATMTVRSRIDFSTGGFVLIECDPANATNDNFFASYVGTMQATFIMSNVTATPFAAGQTFTIVNSQTGIVLTNGGLATHVNQIPLVSPVVPGVGLQWNRIGMTNFALTRTLSVVAAPLTSPFLTNVFTPTNLIMSWPATHLGYQLKVQTNTHAVGISSNWFPIPGSENTNTWTVLVDTNQPTVFYRLSNQP